MTNDWLKQWQWPENLRAQRWLILGTDLHQLSAAAIRRGAIVTTLPLNDEQPLPRADVIVAQELFRGIRHPLWWLEKVCTSTMQDALLHCWPARLPVERALLSLDDTENWQANRIALVKMARAAGFAQVSVLFESVNEIWLRAARRWPDFPADLAATMTIRRAFNPVTGRQVFPRSGRTALVALWVEGLPTDARRWEVRASIGGFGIQPLRVALAPEPPLMQINLALPPGMPLGQTTVELWHRQLRATPYAILISEGTQW